ncbi:MAG: hypothetical protein JSW00_05615, partial [Thermoplasmata archaeon]
MNLSKKYLVIISVVIALVVSNTVFALLWMTRDVDITGGVSVVGAIEVYDEDGTTLLTDITFENYTGGVESVRSQYFFINNTGNQPVYVYWNISSSSVSWTPVEYGYLEQFDNAYVFQIYTSWSPDPTEYWSPNDYTTPEALYIAAGQGK